MVPGDDLRRGRSLVGLSKFRVEHQKIMRGDSWLSRELSHYIMN